MNKAPFKITVEVLQRCGEYIALIPNPTDEMCFAALESDVQNYRYILNPSENVSIRAVSGDVRLLQHVNKQTKKIIQTALKCGNSKKSFSFRDIHNMTPELALLTLSASLGESISALAPEEHTRDFLLRAVEKFSAAYEYAHTTYPEVDWAYIEKHPHLIGNVKNQTPELCMMAVSRKPAALKGVHIHTEELVLKAIEFDQGGDVIQYAHIQTEAIAIAAMQKSSKNLDYIWDITGPVTKFIIEKDSFLLRKLLKRTSVSEELILKSLIDYPNLINSINSPTREMCLVALEREPVYLKKISHQTQEYCDLAVKEMSSTIEFAHSDFLTEELCLHAAISSPPNILYFIGRTDFSLDFYLECVQGNGLCLRYFHTFKTPEMELAAVKQNWMALQYVSNLTEEICLAAYEQDVRALILMQESCPSLLTGDSIYCTETLRTTSTFNPSDITLAELESFDLQRKLEYQLHSQRLDQGVPITSRRRMDIL